MELYFLQSRTLLPQNKTGDLELTKVWFIQIIRIKAPRWEWKFVPNSWFRKINDNILLSRQKFCCFSVMERYLKNRLFVNIHRMKGMFKNWRSNWKHWLLMWIMFRRTSLTVKRASWRWRYVLHHTSLLVLETTVKLLFHFWPYFVGARWRHGRDWGIFRHLHADRSPDPTGALPNQSHIFGMLWRYLTPL